MKAIILAAGRGSRLKGLTDACPKALVSFRGKRLIDYQLDALSGAGIDEISLVRGYQGEKFDQKIHFFENMRWHESNMVTSLTMADTWLNSDDCIVSYSDIVYGKNTVKQLLSSPADITIAYDPNWRTLWEARFDNPLDDAETFRIGGGGMLLEIGKKASNIEEIQGQYMGLLKFSPSGWLNVTSLLQELTIQEQDSMDMTSLLQKLIERGISLSTVAINEPWFEIDNPSDIKLFEK